MEGDLGGVESGKFGASSPLCFLPSSLPTSCTSSCLSGHTPVSPNWLSSGLIIQQRSPSHSPRCRLFHLAARRPNPPIGKHPPSATRRLHAPRLPRRILMLSSSSSSSPSSQNFPQGEAASGRMTLRAAACRGCCGIFPRGVLFFYRLISEFFTVASSWPVKSFLWPPARSSS